MTLGAANLLVLCARPICAALTRLNDHGARARLYVQKKGPSDGFESATATIDPLLSIDPSNPNAAQYGLFLSSEIPTAVPVPAALPLLASGLGIFAVLGRRRTVRK